MKISVATGNIAQFEADAIIINLFEGVKTPGGGTGAVDKALDGALSEELNYTKAFEGKLGQILVMNTYGKIPARYVVVVGLGKSADFDAAAARRASAAAVRACQKLKIRHLGTLIHGGGIGAMEIDDAARLTVEGTILGDYRFIKRRSAEKQEEERSTIESLTLVENDGSKVEAAESAAALGQAIARNVCETRDLVFDSANHVTPTVLKDLAKEIPGLECKILDRKEMEKLGMGSFLLVAKGSDEPPYLIHLSYKPKGNIRKKISLVGKGLTFDSGGLSLKPSKGMELMKMDMAGAAAVLGTMKAVAELGELDVQVDGFIGTCENMPSGGSSKPGDIVTTMKGKTVEVNNTDAEGRLVLIDVLTYAQQEVNPDEIVDLATLTGAAITALGEVSAAILGTSDELIENVIRSGKGAGEKFWQLPLFEEYKESLKSDVADLINAGSKGQAGTASAAMFLKEFIDDERAWAHLDIAGPAYTSKDQPEVPKGATGFGVRTLLYYLYNLK